MFEKRWRAHNANVLPSDDLVTADTLGVVFSKAGALKETAQAFARAVELDPCHANHHFNLAASYLYFGYCLSNFRQLFAFETHAYDYSFDLMDTGRYYLQFDRLMRHWQALFPGRIYEVAYEDLVTAQRQTTASLLEFCGLPWQEDCLKFEHNHAPVATASLVQVRSAMNRDSLRRWRRYAEQLSPLRELLEQGGICID